eukprot:COSAG04_NODE_2820_length_3535_cov_4.592549_2_plen_127_part_00
MRRTTGTPVSLQVVQPMVQPCENHIDPPLLARPSLALRESGSIICAAGTHQGLPSSPSTRAVRTMPCPLAWATSAVKVERRSMPPALQAPVSARYPQRCPLNSRRPVTACLWAQNSGTDSEAFFAD